MITIVDMVRAVSGVAERVFGAPPTTKDVREGFTRPTTYLTPVAMRTERQGGLRHDSADLELVYFAQRTDRGWIDLLRAQEKLADALCAPIPVTDSFHLLAEEVAFDAVREDMALYCTFSVETYQQLDEADDGGSREAMERLKLNNIEYDESEGDANGTA